MDDWRSKAEKLYAETSDIAAFMRRGMLAGAVSKLAITKSRGKSVWLCSFDDKSGIVYVPDDVVTLGAYWTSETRKPLEGMHILVACGGKNLKAFGTFFSGSSLSYLDLRDLNCRKVKSLDSAFYNCRWLTRIAMPKTGFPKVEEIKYMFKGCYTLLSLDASALNTSLVKDMTSVFYGCHTLTKIDLSSWDFSSVENVSNMFSCCDQLREVNMKGVPATKLVTGQGMFVSCTGLKSVDLFDFSSGGFADIHEMFAACYSLNDPRAFPLSLLQ